MSDEQAQPQTNRRCRRQRSHVYSSRDAFEVATGPFSEDGWPKLVLSYTWELVKQLAQKLGPPSSGHADDVRAAAFDPVFGSFATAGSDKTCRLWAQRKNPERPWQEVQTLNGHSDGVNAVAFSSDGRHLATASHDCNCRVWARVGCGSWSEEQVLQGHDREVQDVAFSFCNRFLATGSRDKTCRLWMRSSADGDSWINFRVLTGHKSSILGVAFSPDDHFLATASIDKTCRLWNFACGKDCASLDDYHVLTGHEGWLYKVTFAPAGRFLATASKDKTCRVWEYTSSASAEMRCNLVQILSHDSSVNGVAFCSETCLLATVSDSACHLWSAASNSVDAFCVDGCCLSFAAEDPQAANDPQASLLGDIEGHSIQWRKLQDLSDGHRARIFRVDFVTSESGLMMFTCSADKTSILWRVDSGIAYKAVHIRPPKAWEVLVPLGILIISFCQKMALALVSKDIPWSRQVRYVAAPLSLSLIPFGLDLFISPSHLFWLRSVLALLYMLTFILCAILQYGKWFIRLTCVAFVVPMVKQAATIFTCTERGHVLVLAAAPDGMTCYSGSHLWLCFSAVPIVAIYCYLLLPFTAAEGDLALVPCRDWWPLPRIRKWRQRKADKANGLDLGLLQPSTYLLTPFVDLIVRIVLSCNAIVSRSHPRQQVFVSLGACAMLLLANIVYPPKVTSALNATVYATDLLACIAWAASAVAVYNDDPNSVIAAITLYGGIVVVVGGLATFVMVTENHRSIQNSSSRELSRRHPRDEAFPVLLGGVDTAAHVSFTFNLEQVPCEPSS